jgi:hypothetical protein
MKFVRKTLVKMCHEKTLDVNGVISLKYIFKEYNRMDLFRLPQDREEEKCHGTSGSIKSALFSGL